MLSKIKIGRDCENSGKEIEMGWEVLYHLKISSFSEIKNFQKIGYLNFTAVDLKTEKTI